MANDNNEARAKICEGLRQLLFEETADVYDNGIAVGFEMSARAEGIRLSYEAAETILRLLKPL